MFNGTCYDNDQVLNATVYFESGIVQIGDTDEPGYSNISYTNPVSASGTQVIYINFTDNSGDIASATLNLTSPALLTSTVVMSKIVGTSYSYTFSPGSGTWLITGTDYEDGNGNSNSTELNESFIVSAAAGNLTLPGGGGGAPDLKELGEECTDNSDCLSQLCDTQVTETCVETLCGNGYCDETTGENINNCAQDCSTFKRFDFSQATFAKYAFYLFIAIIFILVIEPDAYNKMKRKLVGGKRRR